MSLRQAWRQTSIGNKIGAVCGVTGVVIALGSTRYSYLAAGAAHQQNELTARTSHEQRLLDWERLRLEDDSTMPNISSVTVPSNNPRYVAIELTNNGKGPSMDFVIDDAVTNENIIHYPYEFGPGDSYIDQVSVSDFHRAHLMRKIIKSPHDSTRTITFYFDTDHVITPVSDTIDRPFDFLLADEPGRKNHVPVTGPGFVPPGGSK
jgi:hypothetical protein